MSDMNIVNENDPHLPDVSKTTKTSFQASLDRVGMKKIEMPLTLNVEGQIFRVPATLDAFVNLVKSDAKGIHMSRLYKAALEHLNATDLSFELIEKLLLSFVENHQGLSTESFFRAHFELPIERKALLSSEKGWRQYPVQITAQLKNKKIDFEVEIRVLYSSTCPCSAALSRRLVAEKFVEDFKALPLVPVETVMSWLEDEKSIIAVPHSQRSEARIQLKLSNVSNYKGELSALLVELINRAESSLGTPVQSAVKRIDEQEFARLNGTNLMFCEDAARKLKLAFDKEAVISDFLIEVHHRESLHAHDAVSIVTKGIAGGYTA